MSPGNERAPADGGGPFDHSRVGTHNGTGELTEADVHIVRVADCLGQSNIVARALAQEKGIEWVVEPAQFDYVRQAAFISTNSCRKPRGAPIEGGRIVGYSVGETTSKPGRYARRVFFVKRYDRSGAPNGRYRTGGPLEMVDPRTLKPGFIGLVTARAEGIEEELW